LIKQNAQESFGHNLNLKMCVSPQFNEIQAVQHSEPGETMSQQPVHQWKQTGGKMQF